MMFKCRNVAKSYFSKCMSTLTYPLHRKSLVKFTLVHQHYYIQIKSRVVRRVDGAMLNIHVALPNKGSVTCILVHWLDNLLF